jgi:predicted nucleotidyltransferase
MAPNQSIASQIKEAVKNTDASATAILYGSRAKGKARDDSDWDILILLDKPKVTLQDERIRAWPVLHYLKMYSRKGWCYEQLSE